MKTEMPSTGAVLQYARVYAAHYTTKDLNEALELYRGIMTSFPDSKETDPCR